MAVMVTAMSILMAQFVMENAASVFKGMYHLTVQEQVEHPEDARLVHRRHECLKIGESHGTALFQQRLEYEYSVGCRPDALALYAYSYILATHYLFFSRSRISVRSFSSAVGSGAFGSSAAGVSFCFFVTLLITLMSMKIQNATIRKSRQVCRKLP